MFNNHIAMKINERLFYLELNNLLNTFMFHLLKYLIVLDSSYILPSISVWTNYLNHYCQHIKRFPSFNKDITALN